MIFVGFLWTSGFHEADIEHGTPIRVMVWRPLYQLLGELFLEELKCGDDDGPECGSVFSTNLRRMPTANAEGWIESERSGWDASLGALPIDSASLAFAVGMLRDIKTKMRSAVRGRQVDDRRSARAVPVHDHRP